MSIEKMSIEKRLEKLGIILPSSAVSVSPLYVPFIQYKNIVFISGQLAVWEGKLKYSGQLGAEVSLAEGQAAARLCVLNVLAHVKNACQGDLGLVERCLRVEGYVNATPTFQEHPQVINGASALISEIFEDRGTHTRIAIGVSSLPLASTVEISAIFALKEEYD